MRTPKQIIDELFAQARAKEPENFKSINDEAGHLGISVGHLSRIKNMRVPLTDEVIERIVNAFGGDEDSQTNLRQELRLSRDAHAPSAQPPTPKSVSVVQGAVSDFFARHAKPNHLLCCEYRDLPQISDIKGAFPSIADDAARAVAAGMAYAFFQPFGKPEVISQKITECITMTLDQVGLQYLLDVAMSVRNAYHKVKTLAEEINPDVQIMLYEADKERIEVSGIQSRLFYVDYPGTGTKERIRKIYQWISGVDNHYFIERDKETISVGALAEQFLPVTKYWSLNNRLPSTDEELREAETKCGGTVKWSIWKPNAQAAQAN